MQECEATIDREKEESLSLDARIEKERDHIAKLKSAVDERLKFAQAKDIEINELEVNNSLQ